MLCANHAVGGMRRCTEPPRRGPPPAPPHTLRGSARSPGARPQKQFPYSVETTVSATQHRLRLHHPSGQQLAAIYPVASSDLPGPSPTRQSAGTSSRVAGIVSHPARPGHPVQTTFPHRNRLLLQCLASLHGRNRIPSGPLAVSSRNAAHHSPDSGSGLAPATPAQGGCWGCQLTAARCSRAPSSPPPQPTTPAAAPLPAPKADRPRWTRDGPAPVSRTVPPPGPIAPGRKFALSAVPECWQCSLTLFRVGEANWRNAGGSSWQCLASLHGR